MEVSDRMVGVPTITVGDLRPLSQLATQAGFRLPDILRTLGLPPELLHGSSDSAISLADYFRILEQLATIGGDETCHLSARPLMPGTTRFVLSNLSECGDLFEAMRLIARSYNIVHGGPYNSVERRDGFLVYAIDDREFPYTLEHDDNYIHFTMECVLVFLQGILSLVSSDRISSKLRKVYTKRPRVAGSARHLAFWRAPIRYKSSRYALFYDLSAASLPVTFSAEELPPSGAIYDSVVALIDKGGPPAERAQAVADLVRGVIAQGVPGQPQVARRLGMSVATLRRRLADENASFREIRRDVLNDSAKSLLTQRSAIGEVAEDLGFSDFRSFSRAFKNWNGITPKSYLDSLAQKRRR